MKTSWSFLILFFFATAVFGQNHAPVTVNDTFTAIAGNYLYITSHMLLHNDYDPDGDSIVVKLVAGFQKVNDTSWKSYMSNENDSVVIAFYFIQDQKGLYTYGSNNIIIRLKGYNRVDSLTVNNINALISPLGQHFRGAENAHFEVPKGSGKHSIFNQTILVGAYREGDTLCLAAERYRQRGADFFVGPITTGFDTNYYIKWSRVWKIDKTQIQYHINNWNQPGYAPIEVIKNWPANGDVTLGQSADIAPFYDKNTNGVYEPMMGEYPLIRGDQAVFFVFNDSGDIHTKSDVVQPGIEIHGMAYGYDRPDDSTLNNTLFMHYDIINRSAYNFYGSYLGLFSDFDLGYPMDDYIGSDVTNGMIYGYNGTSVDGTGQAIAYGEHPPAIGLKVIGGPYLAPDGIDNPSGDCGYSLNGLNFGDNIADNERMGMTNFINIPNLGDPAYWVPRLNIEFYRMMQSLWMDGTQIMYGGVGPDCDFMFPGNSDTVCNYGTNGILPNGGLNQNGNYWTEATSSNAPHDRRGLASIGPFNFNAGQTVPLDYCFTWARAYQGDNNASVELLRDRIAALAPAWNNLIKAPVTYFGVPEKSQAAGISVFPNPLRDKATVTIGGTSTLPYRLLSINGKLMQQGTLKPGNNQLDISTLKPGIYILKSGSLNVRIVKM